jgi:hypothetical protein
VILDGDAQLGADAVLQGWCWNSKKPTERPVVEILIGERIVSTVVASRFREDLRERNIGDGYYGFMATLTKSIADAGDNFVISARERASGRSFWRQVRGESALPSDFAGRIANVQRRFSRLAWSSRFRMLGTTSLTSRFSAEMSALGMHLRTTTRPGARYLPLIARARTALLRQTAPAILEMFRSPKVAVIIIADSTSNDVLSAISAVVPTLISMEASLLLLDRGSNADVALAPSLFGNLRYLLNPRRDLESLLADALKYSHGELLIFVKNPRETFVQGLPEIAAQMCDGDSVYFNSGSVEIACSICAESPAHVSRGATDFPIGLEFAGKRQAFERFRRFLSSEDRVTGRADVDLAIRAVRDGVDLRVWDEPSLERKTGSATAMEDLRQ